MSTHQQLLYHIVFGTKRRVHYLTDGFRERTFAYMAGACEGLGGHGLIVGGYYDHVHLLVRIPARIAVSDFVGRLKSSTSKNINETSGLLRKFGWQDGFGAFSVSSSNKDQVYRYIERQMVHHQCQRFEEEYIELLKRHEIDFDAVHVFD